MKTICMSFFLALGLFLPAAAMAQDEEPPAVLFFPLTSEENDPRFQWPMLLVPRLVDAKLRATGLVRGFSRPTVDAACVDAGHKPACLPPEDKMMDVAFVLGADYFVRGKFALNGKKIAVKMELVTGATDRAVGQIAQRGTTDGLDALASKIAGDILKNLRLKLKGKSAAGLKVSFAKKNDALIAIGLAEAHLLAGDGVKLKEIRGEVEAAAAGSGDSVELLVQHGKMLNALGEDGRNALRKAASMENPPGDAVYAWGESRIAAGETAVGAEQLRPLTEQREYLPAVALKLAPAYAALGRVPDAIALLDRAVIVSPRMTSLIEMLARFKSEAGDWAGAVVTWEKLAALQPKSALAHLRMGQAYVQMKQNEKSVEHFNKALELDPSNGDACYGLATSLFDLGRTAEAESTMKKAIELNPKNAAPYFGLAAILEKQGKTKEAVKPYEDGLKVDPKRADVHEKLGALYEKTGDTPRALDSYRKALAINPERPDVRSRLCLLEYSSREYAAAEATCEAHVRQRPEDLKAIFAMGYSQFAIKKYAPAAQSLRRYTEGRDGDWKGHFYLAESLRNMGDPAAAEASYARAAELKPDHQPAWRELAAVREQQGKKEAAADALASLWSLDGNKIETNNRAADLYMEARALKKAVPFFQRKADADAGNAELRFTFANLLAANGDLDGAVMQLRKIVQRNPGDYRYQWELGRMLTEAGRHLEARQILEKLTENNEKDPRAWNSLARDYLAARDPKLRDPGKAVDYAEKAVDLTQEKDVTYMITAAEAELADDDPGDAKDWLEKALKLDPSNKKAMELMKKTQKKK